MKLIYFLFFVTFIILWSYRTRTSYLRSLHSTSLPGKGATSNIHQASVEQKNDTLTFNNEGSRTISLVVREGKIIETVYEDSNGKRHKRSHNY